MCMDGGGIWRCTENVNYSHGCLGDCFLIQNNDCIVLSLFFFDCDLSRRSGVKFNPRVTSVLGLKIFIILKHFRFLSFWQAVANIYKNNDCVWRSWIGGFCKPFTGQKCDTSPSSLADQSHPRRGSVHCCYYFIYFYVFACGCCVCLCVYMWKQVCMFVGTCMCGCICIHVHVDVCGCQRLM